MSEDYSNFTLKELFQEQRSLNSAAPGDVDPSSIQRKIQSITMRLLEIYQNPEVFQPLFGILLDIGNNSLRMYAAVAVRLILVNQWSKIVDTPAGPRVMESFVEVLRGSLDLSIVKIIVNGIEPIIEGFGETWTDLLQTAFDFLGSSSVPQVVSGLVILASIIPHSESSYIAEISPSIFDSLVHALAMNSNQIAAEVGNLFASIFNEKSSVQYIPSAHQVFEGIFKSFVSMLYSADKYTGALAISIGHMFKSDLVAEDRTQIFSQLCYQLDYSAIPSESRHLAFSPLTKLVKYSGDLLRQYFPDALNLAIQVSASQFEGRCYEFETDARSIEPFVSMLAATSNLDEFFALIMATISASDNEATRFASICCLYSSIIELSDQIEQNSSDVVTFLIESFHFQSHSIKEAVLSTFTQILDYCPETLTPFAEEVLSLSLNSIQLEDQNLTTLALTLIQSSFYELEYDFSQIYNGVTKLLSLRDELPTSYDLLFSISAAIKASKDECALLPDSIFSLMWEAAHLNDSQYAYLKKAALESLSLLMCYAPQKLESAEAEALALIVDSMSSDDAEVLQGVRASLKHLVRHRSELFSTELVGLCVLFCQGSIDEAILKYSQIDENEQQQNISVDVATNSLKLLRSIIKFTKIEQSPDWQKYSAITYKECSDLIQVDIFEISSEAMKVAASLIAKLPAEKDFFLKKIEENCNREESSVVAAALNCVKKMIICNPEVCESYTEKFMKLCIRAINRDLKCQSKSVDEVALFNYEEPAVAAVDLISEYIDRRFDSFPADEFLDCVKSVSAKISPTEIEALIGPIAVYVSKGGTVDADIFSFCYDALKLVDFKHGPNPIFFFASLAAAKAPIDTTIIESLLEFAKERLGRNNQKERYFWETETNIVSLLLWLNSSYGADIGQFIPAILSVLPVRGDYDEGRYIYGRMIDIFDKNSALVQQNRAEIVRLIAETLSMRNKAFDRYHLEVEQVKGLAKLFRSCLDESLRQNISKMLGEDQVRIAKLQERLGEIQ